MKQTILAVDDERAIVQLCTVMLEQAGFSVLSATKS
jgi:DNA-binding response OmpR family regulator